MSETTSATFRDKCVLIPDPISVDALMAWSKKLPKGTVIDVHLARLAGVALAMGLPKDTKALAEWYIKLFGLRVVYDNGKQPPTFLLKAPDGMVIEILPATSGAKTDYSQSAAGFRHLAVTVDDYAAAEARLREHGITDFIERRETQSSKL